MILRKTETPRDLVQGVLGLNPQSASQDPAVQDPESRHTLRTYGIGAQILVDLGVRRMRVLSAPKRMQSIGGFGLEVVGYEHCD